MDVAQKQGKFYEMFSGSKRRVGANLLSFCAQTKGVWFTKSSGEIAFNIWIYSPVIVLCNFLFFCVLSYVRLPSEAEAVCALLWISSLTAWTFTSLYVIQLRLLVTQATQARSFISCIPTELSPFHTHTHAHIMSSYLFCVQAHMHLLYGWHTHTYTQPARLGSIKA